ncbi:type IV pilus modification protein PilV [Ferrimonas lipolytica]|uniref:Type IV pilus modification protein PilV n=1 Tax=Ferrimonas lipolytica TaxID=2724191 RepID=A0A6H1UAW8_9GAMM|nr:type IV pilus modification protein PilV [Ferrimonas lipolytica]QIZ75503.1 type IV pilus modification protein PilV [Ferrimonas lipolytica]
MDVRHSNIHQRGFTLIEVMVAGVVLSIGLLGVFQLHLYTKRSSHASINYAEAAYMAADMLDRIRLNPNQRDNYVLSNYDNGSGYGSIFVAQPDSSQHCTKNPLDSSINECTPEQLRAWDQYQWNETLKGTNATIAGVNIGAVPGLVGCIFVSGNDVEVVISWQGLVDSSDAADRVGNSSNAKSCGASGTKRRQVVLNSVIMDTV